MWLIGMVQAEMELQGEETATLRLHLAQARAAAEQRAELARRCAPSCTRSGFSDVWLWVWVKASTRVRTRTRPRVQSIYFTMSCSTRS